MKCTPINICLATELFSVEYCEIETNEINLANHIRGSQSSELRQASAGNCLGEKSLLVLDFTD